MIILALVIGYWSHSAYFWGINWVLLDSTVGKEHWDLGPIPAPIQWLSQFDMTGEKLTSSDHRAEWGPDILMWNSQRLFEWATGIGYWLNKLKGTFFQQQSFRYYLVLPRKKAILVHAYLSLMTLFCSLCKLQWWIGNITLIISNILPQYYILYIMGILMGK